MNQITRMSGEQLLVLRVLAGRRFEAAIVRELDRRARIGFARRARTQCRTWAAPMPAA